MILIYITCKDKEEAKKISQHLLKKRLIACANMFPIRSSYWWKGEIEETKEFVIIAKTLEEKFLEILEEVKKIHSYEIPCILKIRVEEVNEEYLKWIKEEVE